MKVLPKPDYAMLATAETLAAQLCLYEIAS